MAEGAAVHVPSARSFGSGLVSWGIPLIAGVAGFFAGDVFDAYGLVTGFTEGFLAGLPLSDKLDFNAFAAAGVYGIGIVVAMAVEDKVPGGMAKTIVFRTVKWGLIGITARLALRGLLPGRVTATGAMGVPIPDLTP